MMFLSPPKLTCHFCMEVDAVILFPNGQGLCCKCFATLSPHIGPDDIRMADRKPSLKTLAHLGSLELISQAVVKLLKDDGENITNIAKKLGITRSTVYRLLEGKTKCKPKR